MNFDIEEHNQSSQIHMPKSLSPNKSSRRHYNGRSGDDDDYDRREGLPAYKASITCPDSLFEDDDNNADSRSERR